MQRSLILSILLLGLSSCGIFNLGDAVFSSGDCGGSTDAAAQLALYESTIYTAAMDRCSACHASQAPLFISEDPSVSFNAVQSYIDRLAAKETDGHCGANCAPNAANRPVSAAVDAFKGVLCVTEFNTNDNADRYYTVALDLASARTGTFDTFVFEMDADRVAEPYKSVIFSAEIRNFPAEAGQPAYVMARNIRVQVIQEEEYDGMRARGFQFVVNGVFQKDESWERIDLNLARNGTFGVGATARQDFILSGKTIPFVIGQDQLILSVQLTERNGPPGSAGEGGEDPERSIHYAQKIAPTVFDRCNGCHAHFVENAAQQEAEADSRITRSNPGASRFLQRPLTGANHSGGDLYDENGADAQLVADIEQWINWPRP